MPLTYALDGTASIRLETRRGQSIENVQDPEYTAHQREMEERKLIALFPLEVSGSVKRRDASNIYNCHGMTFALRRTAILEERFVQQVLTDDGYREIMRKQAMPGDVVLYYNASGLSHSGIVVFVDHSLKTPLIKVMSKWGRAGEFVHDENVHPYRDVNQVRFFRDYSDA